MSLQKWFIANTLQGIQSLAAYILSPWPISVAPMAPISVSGFPRSILASGGFGKHCQTTQPQVCKHFGTESLPWNQPLPSI